MPEEPKENVEKIPEVKEDPFGPLKNQLNDAINPLLDKLVEDVPQIRSALLIFDLGQEMDRVMDIPTSYVHVNPQHRPQGLEQIVICHSRLCHKAQNIAWTVTMDNMSNLIRTGMAQAKELDMMKKGAAADAKPVEDQSASLKPEN